MHTNSARTSMVFIMASNPEKNKKDMSGLSSLKSFSERSVNVKLNSAAITSTHAKSVTIMSILLKTLALKYDNLPPKRPHAPILMNTSIVYSPAKQKSVMRVTPHPNCLSIDMSKLSLKATNKKKRSNHGHLVKCIIARRKPFEVEQRHAFISGTYGISSAEAYFFPQ